MTIESSPFRGFVALKRYLPVMHVGRAAATDGQKVTLGIISPLGSGLDVMELKVSVAAAQLAGELECMVDDRIIAAAWRLQRTVACVRIRLVQAIS